MLHICDAFLQMHHLSTVHRLKIVILIYNSTWYSTINKMQSMRFSTRRSCHVELNALSRLLLPKSSWKRLVFLCTVVLMLPAFTFWLNLEVEKVGGQTEDIAKGDYISDMSTSLEPFDTVWTNDEWVNAIVVEEFKLIFFPIPKVRVIVNFVRLQKKKRAIVYLKYHHIYIQNGSTEWKVLFRRMMGFGCTYYLA